MEYLLDFVQSLGGALFTTITVILCYIATRWLFAKQDKRRQQSSVIRQVILACIVLIGFIAIILALPLSPDLKGQITSLMGIVLSAAFALSSTTFLGNALAGIMNRSINHFQLGDFIRVGDYFGKVSDMGLFHTEIQGPDRDLLTLPNMYLANNPVKVMRNSGTIVSATMSLGYDVSRKKIEKVLIAAATEAGLTDAFVLIKELGDFSVVYELNGLLKEPSKYISTTSRLYALSLDHLHNAYIEIVSPTFMNQRQVNDTIFIPKKERASKDTQLDASPEALIFDKAMKAETIEKKKSRLNELQLKIDEMKTDLKKLDDPKEKEVLQARIDKWASMLSKTVDKVEVEKIELNEND